MLRNIFPFLLLLHGLIHLLGFAKAFKLAEVPQLGGQFSRPAGLAWLAAAVLFVLAVALFILEKDWWWMPAAAAVALSQILIFTRWHDARFGTIINVIALAGAAVAFGRWNFNQMVEREVAAGFSALKPADKILTREMTAQLPPIVQKWLERSGAVGKKLAARARLHQKGQIRTSPESDWVPVEANQYVRLDRPGFLWAADMKFAPLVHVAGRDKYEEGQGHMLIKALWLVPIADAKGPAIDQGSMLRFLAEICWCPSAAVADYIRWEPVDSLSARAVMSYGDVEASGVFTFTPDGDPVSFDALRYYDRKQGATLEKWHIDMDPGSYRAFEGIRIPTQSAVTWQLEQGDFTWYRLEITEMWFGVDGDR